MIVLVVALLLSGVQPGKAQILLVPKSQAVLALKPNENQAVQVAGEPHSLQVLEVHFDGGLISLQSPEAVRRLLDLGRNGRLLFAVEVPEAGVATVQFVSSERLRTAEAHLKLVTDDFTPEQRRHLHTAGILFALADSARRHQHPSPGVAAALDDYEQAATEAVAAGDPSLARWALTQKARFLLYQKSSFQETQKLLERAAALAPAADAATQALLYKTLSSCEYFLGNLPESVLHGEHALALYRKTGDQYWQGVVLGNLIAGYGEMGRNDDAAAAAREALTDAEQTQDTAGVVFCLTELANLYTKEGELQLALLTFREAKTWAEDIRYAPLVQAEIEQALGQFYMDFGLWTEAEMQLSECLKHASANSASALAARGLLARAMDRRGDRKASLQEYDSAIASARELKLAPQEASLLLGRSTALLKAHLAAAALADARDAAHLAVDYKSPSLRIQAALAEGAACLEACTDKSQSAEIYRDALNQIEQTGEREQESMAYGGLARVDAALGNDKAAFENVGRALDLLERSRASIAVRDLAGSYFVERREWYAFATDLAMRLDRSHPEEGYSAKAFQLSERARARALLDALGDLDLSRRDQDAAPPASVDLLRRVAANQYKIEAQKAQLLADDNPQKAATALQSLYQEQDALDAERNKRLAALPAHRLNQIASISEIQSNLLDEQSALLAIAPGEHNSYRWLITRDSIHIDILPATSELYRQLDSLQRTLQRTPSPSPGEDAATFSARLAASSTQRNLDLQRAGLLLLPRVPHSIHRLYLITDGALPAIPWNVLRTTCDGRPCYAIERYAISIEPSASVAAALARRSARTNREGALVIGDTLTSDAPLIPRWGRLETLPGSQREAHAIAQLLPASDFHNLRRADATVSNLDQGLHANVNVLHIAAHTLFITGHPELSGIALSAESGRSNAADSILWLHDIPHLDAPPLVVLSGCTTQGGNLSSEELASLAQAFFYAGAQQVVASSWPVDDDATVALMAAFYRNLIFRKMRADDALRSAQLTMLARHADLTDWGAFLIDGVAANTPVMKSGGS